MDFTSSIFYSTVSFSLSAMNRVSGEKFGQSLEKAESSDCFQFSLNYLIMCMLPLDGSCYKIRFTRTLPSLLSNLFLGPNQRWVYLGEGIIKNTAQMPMQKLNNPSTRNRVG